MKSKHRRILGYLSSQRHKLPAALRLSFSRHPITQSIFRRPNKDLPPPTTIFIRITKRCNLHCSLCGQWGQNGIYNKMDKAQMLREELSLADWKAFIDSVAGFKPYIMITGGELLLRNDIVELVQHISDRGLLCHINSNSTLIESKADDLVKAGLDFISFSLDAPEKINAEITGNDLAFKRVVAGITRLAQARDRSPARLPVIQMFTVVSEKNQGHLFEMAEIAEQMGVDKFIISFPIFTTPALERASAEIFKREFGIDPVYWKGFIADMSKMNAELIENQLAKIRSRRWKFQYQQFPEASKDFSAAIHFKRPDLIQGGRRCGLISTMPVIMPNGDVSTCWDHPDYVVGNIKKAEFLEIWNDTPYKKFRSVLKDGVLPTCSRCSGLH
jgi:radical SAM protein with 4Fe4S-binding SPASM domain